MKDCTKEFLLFSYFGLETSDIEGGKKLNDCELITRCAQRAYLDLNRTLTFCDKANGEKNIKKRVEFRNAICEIVVDGILKYEINSPDDFDEWHNNLCETIKNTAKDYKCENYDILIISEKDKNTRETNFSYGQAQKWLNMTIKYMYLLGRWDDKFKEFINVIHVPVDSYIIDAAWKYKNVKLPLKEEKTDRLHKYTTPSEHVIPWSMWDNADDYKKFQTSLRKTLKEENEIPIKWEGPAWIKIAKKRNKNIKTEKKNSI